LTAPWPRYITLEDIAVNVAAYVPLGFLLSAGLGARYGAAPGALAAALGAAGLSLAMEALQMFLPPRIASNVDLLTNSCGGLIGAMAAPLFAPTRVVGRRLYAWRHRVFRSGMAADAGFVIVCLWLLAQLNPVAQLFGTMSAEQKAMMRESAAFEPAAGAWGRQGCTKIRLAAADRATVRVALLLAWQSAMARPRRKPASTSAKAKRTRAARRPTKNPRT
jgi:hypothetical protein